MEDIKIEKGKMYWVSYAHGTHKAKCLAVTKSGGVFKIYLVPLFCSTIVELSTHGVRAEI